MRSRGPARTPCPSGDRARRGAGPNTRTHKRCCMNVSWNQTPAMCACRRRFVAVYSLARASAITNIASLAKSTTTVGYPDRPIRYVFSFICPVNRRLRFLGPLRIILLRLAINEHTNLTAICTIVHQRNTMHCFSVSMRYTYTTKRLLVAYILQSKRLVHWRPRPWPAINLPKLMYHSLSHQ